MTLIALLLVAATAPTTAQNSVTAEAALEAYRTEFKLRERRCRKEEEGDEIVVCARPDPDDSGPKSLRVPYVRDPGTPIRGEASVDGGGCIRLCGQPVMVPLIGKGSLIGKLGRGIGRALED